MAAMAMMTMMTMMAIMAMMTMMTMMAVITRIAMMTIELQMIGASLLIVMCWWLIWYTRSRSVTSWTVVEPKLLEMNNETID
jgi:hypothetical protein